jgi:hypothetical protein
MVIVGGLAYIGYLVVSLMGEPPPLPQVRRMDPSRPQAGRSALRNGNVQLGKLVRKVAPRYPEPVTRPEFRALLVWAEVTVDEEGNVESVEIARGHPLCNDAVIDALLQWRYTPTLLKGRPVKLVLGVSLPCGKKR